MTDPTIRAREVLARAWPEQHDFSSAEVIIAMLAFTAEQTAATRTSGGAGREAIARAAYECQPALGYGTTADRRIINHVVTWDEANAQQREDAYTIADAILAIQPINREAVEAEAYAKAEAECGRVAAETTFADEVTVDEREWFKRGADACRSMIALFSRNLGPR